MVRAMSDILTITLNPAYDVSTSVGTVTPGPKLRCEPATYDPGGGGVNVSRAISRLGGVSTALHQDTLLPTVFVYDGYAGGAGFAERGFRRLATWLAATREAIAASRSSDGISAHATRPPKPRTDRKSHRPRSGMTMKLVSGMARTLANTP